LCQYHGVANQKQKKTNEIESNHRIIQENKTSFREFANENGKFPEFWPVFRLHPWQK